MSDKPPYRVPSMAEIAAVEPSGFRAVSTFSGCGGGCLGLKMAGIDVVWASEFIPAAAETYRANFPGVHLDTRDIRQVTAADILAQTGLSVGELDLLEGSPPCASFSTAGKRHAGWGEVRAYSDTRQRTDDLFYEYARLVGGLRPKVFIAENVSGLVKGVAKGYFKEILRALKGEGYRVEARLVDASWLGVPQARQRMFFVGTRQDLPVTPAFPRPLPWQYTVRDALPWVLATGGGGFYNTEMLTADRPSDTLGATTNTGNGWCPPSRVIALVHDTSGEFGSGDVTDRPAPTISPGVHSVNAHHFQVRRLVQDTRRPNEPARDVTDSPAPSVTAGTRQSGAGNDLIAEADGPVTDPETGEDISIRRASIGRRWQALRPGERSGGYGSVHPSAEEPYPTVVNSGGNGGGASASGAGSRRLVTSRGGAHWAECRKLTLGELRALSGFPPDFILTGTYAQRWERIGRAVPPVMMSHLAAVIRDEILARLCAG